MDGVVAVASPRVATQDTADGEIESFERTMFLQSLYGILGACGGEPAGRRCQGGDVSPVETDGE